MLWQRVITRPYSPSLSRAPPKDPAQKKLYFEVRFVYAWDRFSRDAFSALPQPNGIWCHQRIKGTGSGILAQVLLFDAPQPYKNPSSLAVHSTLVLYSIEL